MKKLLFVTAFPPNNKSGGQTFSLNLINDLSKSYIIDVLYFTYKNHCIEDNLCVNSTKSFCANNLNCINDFTKHPIFTRRFNMNILRYIADITMNYDVLFFDHIQTGIYSLYLIHPYKVIRCHDVMAQKFSRKCKILKTWIKLTERKILNSVQKIFVPSEKDIKIINTEYGLNANFSHEYIRSFDFYDFDEDSKTFVFFGLWSRTDNIDGLIWFVKNVLPIINQSCGIEYKVIGGGLSEKIRSKYLDNNKNIEYLGFVDNPLDIIYKSSALIAPLFTGAGVKIKVIDAFTTGTPVIGTEIAFEGIPNMKNLKYTANNAENFAEIIHKFTALTTKEKMKNADIFRSLYDKNHLTEQL